MTEDELMSQVRAMIERHRLLWYHEHDSRRSPSGLPDLIIVGKRVLFRELKSESGTLRPGQTRWRWALLASGQDWSLWRPADLASGRIARELEALV